MNALTPIDEANASAVEGRTYLERLDDSHRAILSDARQRIADTRRRERDELKSIRKARQEALAEFDRRETETREKAEADIADDQILAAKMEAALAIGSASPALPLPAQRKKRA